MKRTKEVTKKRLYIEELERPATAWGTITTLVIGEEGNGGGDGKVTTLAIGEEALKP